MFAGRWESAAGMEFMEEASEESPWLQNSEASLADFKRELENIKKLSEGDRKKEENMEELENQMVCFGANLTRQMRGVTWMVKLEVMLSKDSKTSHGMDGRIGPVAGWKFVCSWSWRATGHKARPANQ